MPQLPTRDNLGGTPSVRPSGPIASPDTSSIGRGIASLGRDIAVTGSILAQGWQKADEAATEARFQEFTFSERRRLNDAQRNMQPGEARGFASSYDPDIQGNAFQERARDFFKGTPDSQKHDFDRRIYALNTDLYGEAINFERSHQRTYSIQQLDDGLNTSILPKANLAAELPPGSAQKDKLLGEAIAEAEAAIDAIPDETLTPAEKSDRKRAARRTIQTAFAEALSPEEQIGLDPSRPTQTRIERIGAIESGGNVAPPNGNGGGKYQFIPSTWMDLVRKHRPDLLEGRTEAQVLALREDPEWEWLSDQFANIYARQNEAALRSNGFDFTPTNTYLAHFLGAGGAMDILRADPNAIAAQILPDSAKHNPYVFYHRGENGLPDKSAPKHVKDIIAWARGKMGDTAPMTDWGRTLTSIPYDERVALANDGRAGLIAAQNAARQAAKEQQEAYYDQIRSLIELGQYGEADRIRDTAEGKITGSQSATVRGQIQAVQKDALSLADARAKYDDDSYRFNAYDDEDKKRVNTLYDKGAAQGGEGLLEGDPGAALRLRGVVDRTDIIPSSAVDLIQSGMWSRTGAERDTAFTLLDGLFRENPQAVLRAGFTEKDIARLQDFQALAPILPPQELEQRLNPNLDQRELERRNTLRAEGRKLAAEIDDGTILNEAFDPSNWLFDQGKMPLDPSVRAELRDDFAALYAERFAITGNEEAAQKQAIDRLKTKWGVTEVGSSNYVTAWPPEANYPQFNQSHDWLDQQLDAFVEERYPDARNWFLVAGPETEAAVSFNHSGQGYQAPPYYIGVDMGGGDIRIMTTTPDSPEWLLWAGDISGQQARQTDESNRTLRIIEPQFGRYRLK